MGRNESDKRHEKFSDLSTQVQRLIIAKKEADDAKQKLNYLSERFLKNSECPIMLIEQRFQKWIKQELLEMYKIEDLKLLLTDDDEAKLVWDDFSKWHRDDFVELVREQIKAFLRKNERKR